ncbi:hypothetical protein GCM10007112_17490 [Vulcanisaeta souniana JCM 11219]|uniref:Uncharacterized protein n=1 Tax=Vulcanisaeta souniana JCM 11219 TaxID=1293586 RepID=A0A830EIW6_9CREN|nr:hypothetical protein GCM10007112_17490 [Vulcanisaeta souniana JCM 11219]
MWALIGSMPVSLGYINNKVQPGYIRLPMAQGYNIWNYLFDKERPLDRKNNKLNI